MAGLLAIEPAFEDRQVPGLLLHAPAEHQGVSDACDPEAPTLSPDLDRAAAEPLGARAHRALETRPRVEDDVHVRPQLVHDARVLAGPDHLPERHASAGTGSTGGAQDRGEALPLGQRHADPEEAFEPRQRDEERAEEEEDLRLPRSASPLSAVCLGEGHSEGAPRGHPRRLRGRGF